MALPGADAVGYCDARQHVPSSAGASPTAAWARKRAASVDGLEEDNVKLEQLPPGGFRGAMADEQRDHVCLCTADPKIPRPRNAFILYRISHHTKVAKDNPGLSNPDISKIIGDKWKKEPDPEKDRWKQLAEEEKRRHQQMYPEYRYKPRRASKGQAPRKGGTSPVEDMGRCTKCNGRLLTTPDTFQVASGGPITPKNEINDPMAQGNYAYDSLAVDRRRHSVQVAPARSFNTREEESPEAKRRRLNESGDVHLMQPPTGTPNAYTPRQTGEPLPSATLHTPSRLPFSGGPLPQPGGIPRSQSGPVHAPPRSFSTTHWNSPGHNQRQGAPSSSFQLAPLRTSTPPQPSGLGLRPAVSRHGSDNAPSFAAEVMRIPAERKVSTLMKLLRPLPSSDGGRGQVIAIEGPFEGSILGQVGQTVEQALQTSPSSDVRTWSGDDGAGSRKPLESAPPGAGPGQRPPMSIPDYCHRVFSWHEKSSQIIRHITMENRAGATAATPHSADGVNSPFVGSPSIMQNNGNRLASRTPVALIKNGYCLTESDRFACNSSPAEHWSAPDHWQWAAMLWRGMVAPDLTVYVCPSHGEEIDQLGTVELQRALNLMLVRVPVGTEQLSEAIKRRVAFELMEWMADRGPR